jgi:hypothetical protein
MIDALVRPVWQILKNPFVLIPAVVIGFILSLFIDSLFLSIVEIIYRSTVLQELPEVALAELPLYFAAKYFWNIVSVAVLGSVLNTGGVLVFFAYTNYAKEKKGITESIFYAVGRFWDAVTLALFALIVIVLYLVLAWVAYFLIALTGIGIIAALIMLLFFVLGVYLIIKLYFVPVVMAADELNVREGVAKAWKWSQGRMLSIVVFGAVLALVWSFVTGFGMGIALAFEEFDFFFAAFVVVSSLASAYSALAMANYYLS